MGTSQDGHGWGHRRRGARQAFASGWYGEACGVPGSYVGQGHQRTNLPPEARGSKPRQYVAARVHWTSPAAHVCMVCAAAESNNSRVMWFSLLEACVLVGASAMQLYVVRTWFPALVKRSGV